MRCGLALPSATAPRILLAHAGLDMGADDAAVDAIDAVRRLGRLVDAAQVDDGAHAQAAQRAAVLVGQVAEMGGAEHRAAAHEVALRGAIAAEVAEIGAAFERHDMGERGIEHGRAFSTSGAAKSRR